MSDRFAPVNAEAEAMAKKLGVPADDMQDNFTQEFVDGQTLTGPKLTVRLPDAEMTFTDGDDTYAVKDEEGNLGEEKPLPAEPPKELTDKFPQTPKPVDPVGNTKP